MRRWIAAFVALVLVTVCLMTGGAAQSTTLRVYYMLETPSAFKLFPVDVQVPATADVAHAALQSLLAGPPAGVVKSPFPEGVRLLGVSIKDNVATIDLSSEIMYPGLGSEGEAVLIYSIVNTLSAFPSVQKVRLLVEGHEVETIGGHMHLGEPLTRDYSLLFEGFSDVRGHWSEGAVLALSMSGIISGYPDGTFRPDDEIKRSEFVKLLVQTLGITGEATLGFSDVPVSHWARGSIAAAQSAGIVRPTDGARFRPDEAATRAEMAVWLARALSVDCVGDEPGTESTFTDLAGLDDATRRCISALKRAYPGIRRRDLRS
ncbi:MAG: S-layer homology domain-containing protein [Bacillota bacterium]